MSMIMFLVMFLNYVILVIFVLIGVAFLTLVEQKILGYIQVRKGPEKVGYLGLMQPFADAVKLFLKESTSPLMSNFLVYYFSPVFLLFISLVSWMIMPYEVGFLSFNLGILFFLCCLSVSVYGTISSGWSSNCKYSMMGSIRAVAQTVSYEVSLSLILLSFIFMVESLEFMSLYIYQEKVMMLWMVLPLGLLWFATSLAETSRTPFDFMEGESELVSGFNTEFSGAGFALFFMAEYSSIIFMSFVFCLFFLGGGLMSMLLYLKVFLMSFIFVWIRGTLPRIRYDKLMYLAWKSFLPISLNFIIFFLGVKSVILNFYLV